MLAFSYRTNPPEEILQRPPLTECGKSRGENYCCLRRVLEGGPEEGGGFVAAKEENLQKTDFPFFFFWKALY